MGAGGGTPFAWRIESVFADVFSSVEWMPYIVCSPQKMLGRITIMTNITQRLTRLEQAESEMWLQISYQFWITYVKPTPSKGGFFSESVIRFSNLQISKKKNIPKIYPELEI